MLKEINQNLGITIVVITHQMSVIQEICNKVAIIEHGSLVEEGNVNEIFAKPKSKAAKQLIFGKDEFPENFGNEKIFHDIQELKPDRKIRIVYSENSAYPYRR